jgi:hypothetical protein
VNTEANTFFGINYDTWHGIIAAGLVAVLLPFFCSWLPIETFVLRYLVSVLATSFVVFSLQAMNESWQALDENIEETYGSFKKFQHNSRIDWAMTFIGLGISLVVTSIFIFAGVI